MWCSGCGAQLVDGSRFCDQCGQATALAASGQYAAAQAVGATPAKPSHQASSEAYPQAEEWPGLSPGRRGSPTFIRSHWAKLIDGLQVSAREFYDSVVQGLEERKVPGLQTSFVYWQEANLFSTRRVYLRVQRQEQIFDICAAPFGTGFFFSYWFGEERTPSLLHLVALVVIVFVTIVAFFWLVTTIIAILAAAFNEVGFFLGLLLIPILLVVIPSLLLKNAASSGFLHTIDDFLIRTAFVSEIYRKYLRPFTYYREDTALMFRSAVHSAVMDSIDQLTDVQKLPRIPHDERKPILSDFLKG